MSDASDIEGPLQERVGVEKIDVLVRRLDSLPALPGVVTTVLNLSAEGAETERLAGAAGCDPAIAARLLSLACAKRPDAAPESIEEAVDVLAPSAVRSAVLGMKVIDAPSAGGLDYDEFRMHCLATACASELLAETLRAKAVGSAGPAFSPPVAFACGLLHDIGKAALDICMPKTYRRVLAAVADERGSIIHFEREIVGVDHTVAGRRLAQHWRLPARLQEVIWLHHQPGDTAPAAIEESGRGTVHDAPGVGTSLVAVVQLADAIARRRRLGFSGNYVFASGAEALAGAIGLSGEDISAVADRLPAHLERRMDPGRTGRAPASRSAGDSLYRRAMVGAGAELARHNETLSAQVKVLARQVEALGRLRELAGRVSPATSVPDLCEEIARTFSAANSIDPGGRAPACAFAACNDGQVVLAVCPAPAGGGRSAFRFSPSRPVHPPPTDRPCPAGPIIRSLLKEPGAWSDLIDPDGYTCVPLLAAGRLVGGVLLPTGSAAGQADDELMDALARITAFILATVVGRARADRLAEQLARSSQRLEEASETLAESHALSAVGEMAAGAAHEMNNPLAVISGRAQMLAQRARTKKDRQAADLIADKAQQISDIMTDLMAFAQPGPPRIRTMPVADLLAGAVKRFESQPQHKTGGLVVDIDVQPDCPEVRADAEQMEEVLLELIRNAAEAAEGRVNINIIAERRARSPFVQIRVADDGPGMDESTLASAFTPFFSHMPAGRRRGMGLTRARRAVEAGGGRIWIESTTGSGATVFVELPAATGTQ